MNYLVSCIFIHYMNKQIIKTVFVYNLKPAYPGRLGVCESFSVIKDL
ncbi:hypothetical protein CLOBOL_04466 [Enterocloster bolteae ATCC BAA-613]|uniref:Uncharacterized protein n=1 Tax=Enterocloster bolteae (strain ATCC BAA-613 / DSM 15670 / CCUG 46953 / JCM 12243 / WAL 16351) TaxID=411902 RepID=A8RW34_ENTBW|nr:hypothetical protein CLOBOL_04466 [Enterocloster bolteae ATCC BAA-613]